MGFKHDGNPNFTFDQGYGGATQPMFNGVWDSNDPRTPDFAFHILNVADAIYVPPPTNTPDGGSTWPLLSLAMVGLEGVRRRLLK